MVRLLRLVWLGCFVVDMEASRGDRMGAGTRTFIGTGVGLVARMDAFMSAEVEI